MAALGGYMKIEVLQLTAEDSELAASITRLMSSVFEEGEGSSNARMSELLKGKRPSNPTLVKLHMPRQ